MDMESSSWIAELRAPGVTRNAALSRLHCMLLRTALRESHAHGPLAGISGPELDDMAHQAANDAMIALLSKLDSFRGESRFTTWAYRFVMLEVRGKLGRHFWRRSPPLPVSEDWEGPPTQESLDPLLCAQQRELIEALQSALDDVLTEHQRDIFVAVVIHELPLKSVASQTGSSLGAIYKTIFDARRKIRAFLVANGYLDRRLSLAQRDAEHPEPEHVNSAQRQERMT